VDSGQQYLIPLLHFLYRAVSVEEPQRDVDGVEPPFVDGDLHITTYSSVLSCVNLVQPDGQVISSYDVHPLPQADGEYPSIVRNAR
jgi:hypothetical protein